MKTSKDKKFKCLNHKDDCDCLEKILEELRLKHEAETLAIINEWLKITETLTNRIKENDIEIKVLKEALSVGINKLEKLKNVGEINSNILANEALIEIAVLLPKGG